MIKRIGIYFIFLKNISTEWYGFNLNVSNDTKFYYNKLVNNETKI